MSTLPKLAGAVSRGQINAVIRALESALGGKAPSRLEGGIVDADVDAAASIAYTKLALAGSITDADVDAAAAILRSKLDFGSGLTDADIAAAAGIVRSKLDFGSGLVSADIAPGAAIPYSKLSLGSSIVNADIASAAAIEGTKLNFHVGSTPPITSTSGTLWIYNGSGFYWMFVYDSSETTYKWKFVGGGAANSEVLTDQTTTSTSYADLSTAGPSFTVPRAGDYEIAFFADARETVGGTGGALVSPKLGSATASDNDAAQVSPTAINLSWGIGRTIQRTLAASDVIKLQYRVTSGTGSFRRRNLTVRPIRVS